MKTKIIALVVIVGVLVFSGLKVYDTLNQEYVPLAEIVTPVETMTIEEEPYDELLVYQGTIAPKFIETVSFKSTARLLSFNGQLGQELKAGTLLAALDTKDLELSKEAADHQLYAANADYRRALNGASDEDVELARISIDKAQDGLDYLADQLVKMESLFEEGIISKNELDSVRLQHELALKDLDLAQQNYQKASSGTASEIIEAAGAQVALAKTNQEAQQMLIDDASYVLSEDRVLVGQLYEVGELVPAGYPVAILRSNQNQVTVGVSGKDLDLIKIGQEVVVESQGEKALGQVALIAEIPDEKHFLYEVEISINKAEFKVGEIVNCSLKVGSSQVFMIPIAAIMNDGIDYVYINVDGMANARKVNIVDADEGRAIVTGLNEGDQVIISNLNRIHEQSKIRIEE